LADASEENNKPKSDRDIENFGEEGKIKEFEVESCV
jgi:hypothetical protein